MYKNRKKSESEEVPRKPTDPNIIWYMTLDFAGWTEKQFLNIIDLEQL